MERSASQSSTAQWRNFKRLDALARQVLEVLAALEGHGYAEALATTEHLPDVLTRLMNSTNNCAEDASNLLAALLKEVDGGRAPTVRALMSVRS
jgi:DNA anti-recombination protein RmuC